MQTLTSEDDLYDGFVSSEFITNDRPFGNVPNSINSLTRHSEWDNAPISQMGRVQTSASMMSALGARPMTSNRSSGFSSHGRVISSNFDPLNQGRTIGNIQPLQRREENSQEEQCFEIERRVNELLEETAILLSNGQSELALERIREASKRERMLCKQRENLKLVDQINVDLTYSVQFTLALAYERNGMFQEALSVYNLLIKNTKQFPQAGQLKVNMGIIYENQGKHSLAIKLYRSSLDSIPSTAKDLRFKIMRNVGNCFVKIGDYQSAIGAFESIMDATNDFQTALNLLICYYALGDGEKMKRHFIRVTQMKQDPHETDDPSDSNTNDEQKAFLADPLVNQLREQHNYFLRQVALCGRLIAPVIEKDWSTGFDFVVEQLKHLELLSESHLASELEMCKILNFLKERKYTNAIDGLKSFEKKDKQFRIQAATNLSYLYFLEGNFESGEKYADITIETDKYNAKALVNKGNFCFMRGNVDEAKEKYLAALSVESDCFQALYNLGLVHKRQHKYEEALTLFKRLHSRIDSVSVLYQIADLHDLLGDGAQLEAFNRLIGRVPTDPQVLARVGALYARMNDEAKAFHYHLDSYRHYQVNMDVISWLGAYFVKNELYEKAIQFFERAAQIQPGETKWTLMVASCHRRIGQFQQARALYDEILSRQPDNVDCLRYMVHLLNDANLKEEATEYYKKLQRLENRESAKEEIPIKSITKQHNDNYVANTDEECTKIKNNDCNNEHETADDVELPGW